MDLESTILYEDDVLLVLNKPPGVVVNTSHTSPADTVQSWFAKRLGLPLTQDRQTQRDDPNHPFGTPDEIFQERMGLVHRLDKDTSGVLLLAKTAPVLAALLAQFRDRQTIKIYHALVHGKMVPTSGSIELPLDRSPLDRTRFSVRISGRSAHTDYRRIAFFPGLPTGISEKKGKSYQGFSLVELNLKTGRTHQIRVHMSAIHHPVVGDSVYGGKKRQAIDLAWCPRQFLHASKLVITHPVSGSKLELLAPLPQDLQDVLSRFDAPSLDSLLTASTT